MCMTFAPKDVWQFAHILTVKLLLCVWWRIPSTVTKMTALFVFWRRRVWTEGKETHDQVVTVFDQVFLPVGSCFGTNPELCSSTSSLPAAWNTWSMSHATHSSYACQSENNTDSWIMHEWMKLILEMDSNASLSEHAFGSELLRHTCTKRRRKRMQYHISRVIRGQAEVSDLHMILRVQEDVDRLQVPVDHSLSNIIWVSMTVSLYDFSGHTHSESSQKNGTYCINTKELGKFCIYKSKVGLYT